MKEDNTMDFGPSFVRTVVPLLVGLLISLGAQAGLDLPLEALTQVLTVVISAAYYGLFRWLELKGVTWASYFLGSKKQPVAYAKTTELVA